MGSPSSTANIFMAPKLRTGNQIQDGIASEGWFWGTESYPEIFAQHTKRCSFWLFLIQFELLVDMLVMIVSTVYWMHLFFFKFDTIGCLFMCQWRHHYFILFFWIYSNVQSFEVTHTTQSATSRLWEYIL